MIVLVVDLECLQCMKFNPAVLAVDIGGTGASVFAVEELLESAMFSVCG